MRSFSDRLYRLLNSRHLFIFILVFFVFESGWIALSAAYPQAFDENFHFGLIQVYSHYWFPFLSSQPPNASAYGAVARDPSYLYHYLMSFPYRVIATFYHEQIGQIIMLRFINIGFLTVALVLFRKILRRVGISRSLANVSILLFALIPIAPQLAAQINYDNLLIPLVALVVLLTFDVIDQLRSHKPSVKTISLLLGLCLLTSLVKYAFLPIFLAVVVFLIALGFRSYRHQLRLLLSHLNGNWKKQSARLKILLVGFLLLSAGMFIQRDGINLVKYHNVEPDCATVLSVNACKAYSAWDYSYTNHQQIKDQSTAGNASYRNIFSYAEQWLYWMWYRLFFAVNGPASSFTNYPPLPLPSAAAILLSLGGTFFFIKYWRRIFHNNIYLVLLFVVSVSYIVVLFAQGYSDYHYTDILVNMNGRYLLPVILLVAALIGSALSLALRNSVTTKFVIAGLVLVFFLQGGGFLTFISRSDDTWYLQNNVVQKVNDKARTITDPVIVNGNKQYSTGLWFFN